MPADALTTSGATLESTVDSSHKGLVMRSFDVFFDVSPRNVYSRDPFSSNRMLSK